MGHACYMAYTGDHFKACLILNIASSWVPMGVLGNSILLMQSSAEEIGDFGEATKGGSVRILQKPLGKKRTDKACFRIMLFIVCNMC